MFKTLTAGATALVLTLTTATQGAAQEFNQEDFGKFLFSLVAAAAVAGLVKNARDDDDEGRPVPVFERDLGTIPTAPAVNPPQRGNGRIAPRPDRGDHRDGGWRVDGHPVGGGWLEGPQRGRPIFQPVTVPLSCMREVETRFGDVRMFGRKCLEGERVNLNRLPQACSVQVYTGENLRHGYDPLCLRQNGISGR